VVPRALLVCTRRTPVVHERWEVATGDSCTELAAAIWIQGRSALLHSRPDGVRARFTVPSLPPRSRASRARRMRHPLFGIDRYGEAMTVYNQMLQSSIKTDDFVHSLLAMVVLVCMCVCG
jgi:hypothetical protein